MFRSISDPQNLKDFKKYELDSQLVQLPIDEAALAKSSAGRRFGYFKTLEVFDAVSCMQRGVDETVEKLRKAGHTVVQIDLPIDHQLVSCFLKVFFSDKLESVREVLNGEGK